MLLNLHVKNLALIEETDVEFGEGLNILTGETGAGKSVLLGSINLALGAKFDKDMLRKGADSALVELTFACDDEKIIKKLEELDIPAEDTVTISRRLAFGKSISKINGETVNLRQIKEIAELLIDIHGQHEHQSLLHKKKHLEILDAFSGAEGAAASWQVAALYREVKKRKDQMEAEALDEESKLREQALLEFEVAEIENARLMPGEDEDLEISYRRMVNSKKITEALSECYKYTGTGEADAGSMIGRAFRAVNSVSEYDSRLEQLEEQLSQIEGLLADFNHEISAYLSDMEFDDRDFRETEDRLNEINHLKDKYGPTIEKILESYEGKVQRLEKLADYDLYMAQLARELAAKEEEWKAVCDTLSEIRCRNAKILEKQLADSLMNLNFLSVQFAIDVKTCTNITANGQDDVEFLISTNPGEPLKSLSQVASGGELSRIMLAIKTVLAAKDDIDTLIFDEIDAGISGRTAWKVSEQLNIAARAHQVICITHLPQIAAMADHHFLIRKRADDAGTVTEIRKLKEGENLNELARLLGSDSLSDAAISNAREMRNQALQNKVG